MSRKKPPNSKELRRAYLRAWQQENKKRLHEWYMKNKEKRQKQMTEWRKKNKNKLLKYNAQWNATHKEDAILHKQRAIQKKKMLNALTKLQNEIEKYFNLL